jgi:hypothetical protein
VLYDTSGELDSHGHPTAGLTYKWKDPGPYLHRSRRKSVRNLTLRSQLQSNECDSSITKTPSCCVMLLATIYLLHELRRFGDRGKAKTARGGDTSTKYRDDLFHFEISRPKWLNAFLVQKLVVIARMEFKHRRKCFG